MSAAKKIPVAVLGAGPAGAGAAWKLARRKGFEVTVVERGEMVGGNAGSFDLAGIRADYGSHRLHPSCAPEIMADIRSMLGEELLDRPRHGRIRLHGRWVHFPLRAQDLVRHLPPSFVAGIAVDTVRKKISGGQGDTFASVLEAGLGRTICRDFYFPYARKIWGVEPATLDAEQARRRVSAGSLTKMARKILNSVPGFRKKQGGRFYYPKNGYGAITEAYAAGAASAGARLKLRTRVTVVETSGNRVTAVRTAGPAGEERLETGQVFSSIPVSQLARAIEPAAPPDVLSAVESLEFRAMILIYLVLDTDQFTEFDAHYFPGEDVPITRLSEPKNYGLAHNPGTTILCGELPCSTEDAVWRATDEELGRLMVRALETAGLSVRCPVRAAITRRLAQAYPIYRRGYLRNFDRIDDWLDGFGGLITFGRQGLFAHDNTHHALAMAYALDGCLGDDGSFDRQKWVNCRREFEAHVVED